MGTDLDKPKPVRQEVMDALSALVLNAGNVKRTAREIGMVRKTLALWRDENRDTYLSLCDQHRQALEKEAVSKLSDVTLSATETARLAVQRTHERLEADADNMPAATAQRMMTTAGIAQDKSLALQGRPKEIVMTRSLDEILSAIKARVTVLPDIEGEAEELPG
jgi:transposase-like protein